MHWHILGAGSLGGLWASYLNIAKHPVTLLLKNEQSVKQFNKTPLSLESSLTSSKPNVSAIATSNLDEPIDWLLVTTKSFATLDALAAIEKNLTHNSKIVLLQNGLGAQQDVLQRYSKLTIIAGTSTDGAYQSKRFQVIHAGLGQTLFGAISNIDDKTETELKSCFKELLLDVEWVSDIWTPIWHKVAINCCINAFTALKQCRNGELLEDPDTLEQIRLLSNEVEAIMSESGIEFIRPDLYSRVIHVLEATAKNYSSMVEDFKFERQTEINHINGYISKQGKKLGIATPLNDHLIASILKTK